MPITLSVATGPRLQELGVTDIGELSAYVPGLNIQIQSPHSPGFVIRGITSDNGSAQQPPRVSVYYNGVDISRARSAYQGLFDLARIEVAKGPQATLFGTAATIGAVSLVPNLARPGFSAGLTSAIGNLGALREEGFINIGSERISARVAGQWKKRDGYVPNLAPGQDDLYDRTSSGCAALSIFSRRRVFPRISFLPTTGSAIPERPSCRGGLARRRRKVPSGQPISVARQRPGQCSGAISSGSTATSMM